MNFVETLRIAVTALGSNKLRAVLTTLGIIIGVGAVTSLISLGRGVEDYIQGQFTSLGTNQITVSSSVPLNAARDAIKPLTTKEGKTLANPRIAPSIDEVAMQYGVSATIRAGSESASLIVQGVTPNYTTVNNWNVSEGGIFITQGDLDNNARAAVLGTKTVELLYGDAAYNPMGQTIFINNRSFTVVGVMEQKDSVGFSDPNEVVFVPLSTAQSRLANARASDGSFEVDSFTILVASEESVDSAVEEVTAYLTQAHNIQFESAQDFTVNSQGELLDSLSQTTSILTIFLGAIAGISLFVGGIGIMNIMLVSVTERTREVGLRKAVGARGLDILSQFLVESVILSIVGGLFGIGLGWLVTRIGTAVVSDLTLTLTWDAIVLATSVSSFVGVFFGLYPASRAARMRPIDALRYE